MQPPRGVYVAIFLLLFLPCSVYAQNHDGRSTTSWTSPCPGIMPSIVANEKLKDEYDMASSHFIVVRDDLSSQELSDHGARRSRRCPASPPCVSYHSILGSGIPDFFVPDEVSSMLQDRTAVR